jgi:hypothetical protein
VIRVVGAPWWSQRKQICVNGVEIDWANGKREFRSHSEMEEIWLEKKT